MAYKLTREERDQLLKGELTTDEIISRRQKEAEEEIAQEKIQLEKLKDIQQVKTQIEAQENEIKNIKVAMTEAKSTLKSLKVLLKEQKGKDGKPSETRTKKRVSR